MGITLGGMMSGPMAGVRVIELGVWVAGPAAAGLRPCPLPLTIQQLSQVHR